MTREAQSVRMSLQGLATPLSIIRLVTVVTAALLCAAVPTRAADPPGRVVSLNLCLDQLALAMAAPGQLVGVSDLSHDSRISPRWREAQALPQVRKRAEEILALRPDLLIVDDFLTPSLRKTLRLAGIPTLELAEAGGVEVHARSHCQDRGGARPARRRA